MLRAQPSHIRTRPIWSSTISEVDLITKNSQIDWQDVKSLDTQVQKLHNQINQYPEKSLICYLEITQGVLILNLKIFRFLSLKRWREWWCACWFSSIGLCSSLIGTLYLLLANPSHSWFWSFTSEVLSGLAHVLMCVALISWRSIWSSSYPSLSEHRQVDLRIRHYKLLGMSRLFIDQLYRCWRSCAAHY
jgi:hypothetical protein